MKHLLAILALSGMVVSALALREHYRTDTSPCRINEHWDCGIVNHSPYATLGVIPVAVIGIGGYFLLGTLALRRAYRSLLAPSQGSHFHSTSRTSRPTFWVSGAFTASPHSE